MAPRGLRSSWASMARNSSLRRSVSASASARARSSAARRSLSRVRSARRSRISRKAAERRATSVMPLLGARAGPRGCRRSARPRPRRGRRAGGRCGAPRRCRRAPPRGSPAGADRRRGRAPGAPRPGRRARGRSTATTQSSPGTTAKPAERVLPLDARGRSRTRGPRRAATAGSFSLGRQPAGCGEAIRLPRPSRSETAEPCRAIRSAPEPRRRTRPPGCPRGLVRRRWIGAPQEEQARCPAPARG